VKLGEASRSAHTNYPIKYVIDDKPLYIRKTYTSYKALNHVPNVFIFEDFIGGDYQKAIHVIYAMRYKCVDDKLIYLYTHYPEIIHINQYKIAEILGVTRESVSRALCKIQPSRRKPQRDRRKT
jgi:hypothetical protein